MSSKQRLQETGKVKQYPTETPSKRFYGEGGFVRHSNMSHTTKGALQGYAHKRSGGCK